MVPLNALLSAIVANVDLAPRADEPREWSLGTWLVLCPCVWCCCPGLLVLWLLASNVDPAVAREHWLDMFSFVTGLVSFCAEIKFAALLAYGCFMASTPSTRRLLDGVAVWVLHLDSVIVVA